MEKIRYEYCCRACHKLFGSSLEEPAACPACGREYGASEEVKREKAVMNGVRKMNGMEMKAVRKELEKEWGGYGEDLFFGNTYLTFGKEHLFLEDGAICSSGRAVCISGDAEFTGDSLVLPLCRLYRDKEGMVSSVEERPASDVLPPESCRMRFSMRELFPDAAGSWHLVVFNKDENRMRMIASDTRERLLKKRDRYIAGKIAEVEGCCIEEAEEEVEWIKRNGKDGYVVVDGDWAEIMGAGYSIAPEVVQIIKEE